MNEHQTYLAEDCRALLAHFEYRIKDLHELITDPDEGWDIGPAAGEVASSMTAALVALSDAIGKLEAILADTEKPA
jgi:hypothetical protein